MEDDKVQFITVKCFCLRIEGINALQVTHIWGDKERGNCCTADVFIWLLTKGWVTQKLTPREEQKYFQTYKWEDLGGSWIAPLECFLCHLAALELWCLIASQPSRPHKILACFYIECFGVAISLCLLFTLKYPLEKELMKCIETWHQKPLLIAIIRVRLYFWP